MSRSSARAKDAANASRFAGQAAHDLQEPLRLLAGYLDLLQAHFDGELSLDAKRITMDAAATVDRMQHMVSGLLEYTRLSSRPRSTEPVPLARALADAQANLQLRLAEREGQVTHGALPIVSGDLSDFTRLFQNLLENAIKYRGDGPPRIHVSSEPAAGGWRIHVDDDGPGWPGEGRDRLFQPFARLHDESIEGLGLGLAGVRAIVDRYHGTVRAADAPGGGARVEIFLPGASS